MSMYYHRKAGLDTKELEKRKGEIAEDFESDKFQSVANLDEEMKAAKSAASGFMLDPPPSRRMTWGYAEEPG